jgi:hypothetical protein
MDVDMYTSQGQEEDPRVEIILLKNRVRDLEIWVRRLIYHMKKLDDHTDAETFIDGLIGHILQEDQCKDKQR